MKKTLWRIFLSVTILAVALTTGAAQIEPSTEVIPRDETSELSVLPWQPAFLTSQVCAATKSESPDSMGGYRQCLQSYTQCLNGCQSYPEPTRSQCESWCYQTHWCAQV